MKHFNIILLITGIGLIGIFLPYLPGEYDHFATGISSILQFAGFTSLLYVPVSLTWLILDSIKNKSNEKTSSYPAFFRKIILAVSVIVVLSAALGSTVTNNRFSGIIILISGMWIVLRFYKKEKALKVDHPDGYRGGLYYFIGIPLLVFFFRMTFLEKAKNRSTDFVINQSQLLIQDIEAYKTTYGHYPVSLLSTIEDYKPGISGVRRFEYELNGEAYNIYFEQFSNIVGTQEFVMYNKSGEHELTVHNQDLLRVSPNSIIRGYHQVQALAQPNWKVFFFD